MGDMLHDEELAAIQARAEAASGARWLSGREAKGVAVVHVEFAAGPSAVMRVMRDLRPASEDDVTFIAHARDDVRRLVDAVRGIAPLSEEELRAIAARCNAASPGPWKAFLEEDGGIGGSNVIWVSDAEDQPDLYLWLGTKIAPRGDFEFVAQARQDIPRLLSELNARS